ncbi:MAG: hypothetical protein RQ966_15690, partial [Acetobacteraceae bacterium]|nr:hypothetical protein [Acetobacteraceae bacterium]
RELAAQAIHLSRESGNGGHSARTADCARLGDAARCSPEPIYNLQLLHLCGLTFHLPGNLVRKHK